MFFSHYNPLLFRIFFLLYDLYIFLWDCDFFLKQRVNDFGSVLGLPLTLRKSYVVILIICSVTVRMSTERVV